MYKAGKVYGIAILPTPDPIRTKGTFLKQARKEI